MKQAAAAVGQCAMMHIYDKMFGEYNGVGGPDSSLPARRGRPRPGGAPAQHL